MWKILYPQIRGYCHVTRVEGAVSFGLPDIEVAIRGRGLWVEFKIDKGGYFLIKPTQLAWHLSRIKQKCFDAFFIVAMKSGYDAITFDLYKAADIITLNNVTSVGMQVRVGLFANPEHSTFRSHMSELIDKARYLL